MGGLGFREIVRKIADHAREKILAHVADFRVGERQFLREHADEAALGHVMVAADGFLDVIQPAKNAVQRIGQFAERRVFVDPASLSS